MRTEDPVQASSITERENRGKTTEEMFPELILNTGDSTLPTHLRSSPCKTTRHNIVRGTDRSSSFHRGKASYTQVRETTESTVGAENWRYF